MTLSDITKKLGEFSHQILTGTDNKTLAIGRVVSVPYLGATLSLPFYMAHTGRDFTLEGAAAYVVALAGGFAGLVRGTSSTEPPKE
jgi:hypothetical protein